MQKKNWERFDQFWGLKNDFDSQNYPIFDKVVHNFGKSYVDMIEWKKEEPRVLAKVSTFSTKVILNKLKFWCDKKFSSAALNPIAIFDLEQLLSARLRYLY